MNKRYIPLLITLLFLGMISVDSFGQAYGARMRDKSQAPRKERQAKVKMETVESVVKDAGGQPIPDVLISGKEGAIEVMTDSEGKFKITVPEGTDLLLESQGLETKIVSLKEGVPAEITMIRAPFLMEERNSVDIAFGQVKRKNLIGAVSTLDPKDMKKYDDTEDFYGGLRGKITGLLGINNIRGLGTALIIVDGVPRNPEWLNLNEVDQVSVLKDGNAAMLWGSSAQNGVIQITTKRGEALKRKITVQYEKGFRDPISMPKYLGSAEYMSLYNEARVNDGLSPLYSQSTIANYASGKNPYEYPSVDYYSSEFLRSSKPFNRVLTEMSGGSENTRYYANLGWTRDGTLYELGQANDMHNDRFNMRGNVDFQVNDYIKASVDAAIVFDFNKQPNGAYWYIASTNHPNYFSPLLPISMMESSLTPQIQTAQRINGQYLMGGTSQYTTNPYGIMYYGGDNVDNQRNAQMNATVEADLKNITQGLKFKAFMGFDVYNRYFVESSAQYSVYNPSWQSFAGGDSISGLSQIGKDFNSGEQTIPYYLASYNGSYAQTPYFERHITANLQLNYERTFSDVHHVTGTLLAYYQRNKYNDVIIDVKEAHLGLRLTYDYKQKYYVDFTSTYTNGFHLAPGHMGGYAPSLAVAWNISEEDFMKDSKGINFLKLRASATIQNIDPTLYTGNMNIPLTQEWHPYQESFVSSGSVYWNDVNTTRSTSVPLLMRSANYGLTFEKMKSINAGLEGWFFNRTLYVEGNFFTNRWTGQVIQRSQVGNDVYPSWVGRNDSYTNYNETGHTGGELGVTVSKAYGKFSFEVNANGLYSTSKIVKRSEIYGEPYQYLTGRSADAIFGLVAEGLFKNTTEISESPAQRFSAPAPGDIKYKDINGDNQIDGSDRVQIGNGLPKFSYGLNLVLRYGSFALMATGDGWTDYNWVMGGEYFWVTGNDKYSSEVLNRWTPQTAATATYPRLSTTENSNNFQTSTYWLQNGNFFRLNRVQVTWNVPRKLIQTWPTKEISLYVRGSNLQMWTTKQFQRQLAVGGEPMYRSYALGVNILF